MPKNVGGKKFSELGLPGVEILSGACTSILHLSRGSQLPYSEKIQQIRFLRFFVCSIRLVVVFRSVSVLFSDDLHSEGNGRLKLYSPGHISAASILR